MPSATKEVPASLCGQAQWPTPANKRLFAAVEAGDFEATLRALEDLGANPCYFERSSEGSPSLLHGLSNAEDTNESARCATELLKNGAREVVNSTLISSLNTPLHAAASAGKSKLSAVLVHAKGCPRSANAFGNTPLHSAVHSGSVEIIKLLLENGADVHAKNHRGSTALHIVAVLAKEHDIGQENATNAIAGTDPSVAIASLLITKGKVDVDATDIHGYTALHIAAQRGCNALVVLLVAAGGADLTARTNIDSKGRGGRNAKQMAKFGGKLKTAELIERMELIEDVVGVKTMRHIVQLERQLVAVAAV